MQCDCLRDGDVRGINCFCFQVFSRASKEYQGLTYDHKKKLDGLHDST